MKNLFLFPIRLAGFAVKCAALLAALNLVVAPLLPELSRECESCIQLQERCTVLEAECDRLREELDAEFSMLRRVDLQLLPELEQEWMTIHCFSFWSDVSHSHFEAFPEDTSETIWISHLLSCSLTTLERECSR